MKTTEERSVLRRHAVPLALGGALVVAAAVFWRPLVSWFGGDAADHQAAPAASPPAPEPQAATPSPATPEQPALPATTLPEGALSALQNAYAAYEEVRALLARDQIQGVAVPSGLVARQLHAAHAALGNTAPEIAAPLGEAATAADRMAAATALADARREFAEVSRVLVAVGAADPRLQRGWHLFLCPMTKGYQKWFQRGEKLDNPYMGQAMLTCGSAAKWEADAPPTADAPASAATLSHEGHAHAGTDVAHYTCSMHPSVERKQPGTCPICGMNLSPVTYDELESGVVRVDEARRERIGVKTAKVGRAPMSIAIRAIGRLTFDETRLHDVTLRVSGWITRLRVNSTGQPVRRGETLLMLYSPDLYAAQQEYLLARESHQAAKEGRADYLLAAAEKKLSLWGMAPAQIQALARSGRASEEVPIPAPASGFVIEKNVVEGAAVEPGQRLFRIASLDKVWVEAQVYELDVSQVRKGQTALVTLPYQPGDSLQGTVAYVYPYLDPTSRTGKVRIEIKNKELAFKPDMYANVEIRVDLGPRLQIPTDAVIYTGPRRLVFVDLGEGRFRPQEVTLGARSGEAVEVRAGLRPGDVIVTSGNFLIAAESRIRSAAKLWSDEGGDRVPAEGGHAGH
jgi:Cu(I)/Ag(I) efflux system membrane fusion protein